VLREGAVLGKHVLDKPNAPMNCELDSSVQRRAHDRGRRLIASVGLSAAKGEGPWIAHRRRSLISTIALFINDLISPFLHIDAWNLKK